MSKLDNSKYNDMVANAASKIKASSTIFKAFIADIKAVINGNDDLFDAHKNEKASDDVHGLLNSVVQEIGSNANGRYVKFSNGMALVYGVKNLSGVTSGSVGDFSITLPLSLIVGGMDSATVQYAATSYVQLNEPAIRNVQLQAAGAAVTVFVATPSYAFGTNTRLPFQVIGRWK